jgi:hypothetical protein
LIYFAVNCDFDDFACGIFVCDAEHWPLLYKRIDVVDTLSLRFFCADV